MYLIIISALIALFLWCASRGLKIIFNRKQKYTLLLLCLFSIILCHFNGSFKDMLNKYIIQMNLWIFYGYIPILLLVLSFIKRGKQNDE
jgi:hypothetical protein